MRINTVISIIAVFITIVLVIINNQSPNISNKKIINVLLISWILIPPFWFLTEWWLWGPSASDKDNFEEFKYSQELARNVWVAMSLALGAVAKFSIDAG